MADASAPDVDARELRGLEIASRATIAWGDGAWLVPSQTVPGRVYRVVLEPKPPRCSCPDFADRRLPCKHIHAARVTVEREAPARRRPESLRIGVPVGTPSWITSDMIVRTIQVWQPYYEQPLSALDALEIILLASRLLDER